MTAPIGWHGRATVPLAAIENKLPYQATIDWLSDAVRDAVAAVSFVGGDRSSECKPTFVIGNLQVDDM
jgi:hypothetical protein